LNLMLQTGLVFFICFISVGLSQWIPLPATIIAMIIMLLLLIFKLIKPSQIKEQSDFLLKNMTILFIPAAVEIINYTEYLKDNFLIFLLICLITTIITFVVSAYTVIFVMQWQEKKKKSNNIE